MSGELRTGQFRYTVTPDDDFVIGSPLNAGITTTKYLTFQVTHNTGFGSNPHIRCEYIPDELDPVTHSPGVWKIRFSNDGSNVSDFAYTNMENTFHARNIFAGVVEFTNTVSFSNLVSIPSAMFVIEGLTANRVVLTDGNGTRLISSIVTTFEVNQLAGITSNIQNQLNTKAPLASPNLTGIPTAPTAAIGTNTTQLATTEFVQTAAAANIGLKGYDGRTIVLSDTVIAGKYYRLSVYNGILSLTPYSIPGTNYILLKDVGTGISFKFSIANGTLRKDTTDLPGVYSYTILDFITGVFHRIYCGNGVLKNMPE